MLAGLLSPSFVCECGLPAPRGKGQRGAGRLDPSWAPKRTPTWQLDGLSPRELKNARTLAAHILADAKRGRTERIAELLDRVDLDINGSRALLAATDLANGDTALMLAVANNHVSTVELLLERGSDPLALNRHSQTAGDLAQLLEHNEILEMLHHNHEEALLLAPAAFAKEQPANEWPEGMPGNSPTDWLMHGVRALSFSKQPPRSPSGRGTPDRDDQSPPPNWLAHGLRALSFSKQPVVDEASTTHAGQDTPTFGAFPPPPPARRGKRNLQMELATVVAPTPLTGTAIM